MSLPGPPVPVAGRRRRRRRWSRSTGDEAHHAVAVRRLRVGEQVALTDGAGTVGHRRRCARPASVGSPSTVDAVEHGAGRRSPSCRRRAGAAQGRPRRAGRRGAHRDRRRRDRAVGRRAVGGGVARASGPRSRWPAGGRPPGRPPSSRAASWFPEVRRAGHDRRRGRAARRGRRWRWCCTRRPPSRSPRCRCPADGASWSSSAPRAGSPTRRSPRSPPPARTPYGWAPRCCAPPPPVSRPSRPCSRGRRAGAESSSRGPSPPHAPTRTPLTTLLRQLHASAFTGYPVNCPARHLARIRLHRPSICEAGPVSSEFIRENMSGSRFEDVYLTDARFHDVDLTNARFQPGRPDGGRDRDAALVDLDITGEIENLTVNGVDVAPLVEAELDRRHPVRAQMRPSDAAVPRGVGRPRAALAADRRARPRARARAAPPARRRRVVLHRDAAPPRLRHRRLGRRALLGEPSPWDPLDLPHDEMPDQPSVPRDRDARPSLDEVSRCGGPDGHRAAGGRRAHRRAVRRARPSRSRSRLPRPRVLRRAPRACGRSSTRSGSTGCTPSATSTCWTPGRPEADSVGSLDPSPAELDARSVLIARMRCAARQRPR